jgi:hypothetical protein
MGNYTKPKLRESIKNRVMASGKGGKPGQWSGRKAQLVAMEYKKAGGGYTGIKPKNKNHCPNGRRSHGKLVQVNQAHKDQKLRAKDIYPKRQ